MTHYLDCYESETDGVQWSKYGDRKQVAKISMFFKDIDSISARALELEEKGHDCRWYSWQVDELTGIKWEIEENFGFNSRCIKVNLIK